MVLLVVARFLVRAVPLGWWRATLGRIGNAADTGCHSTSANRMALAVNQAAERLPGTYVCLPRAMALQWMLRRRRCPSALVFGVERNAGHKMSHLLHAWVESGGRVILGDDPDRKYVRGLTLVQP